MLVHLLNFTRLYDLVLAAVMAQLTIMDWCALLFRLWGEAFLWTLKWGLRNNSRRVLESAHLPDRWDFFSPHIMTLAFSTPQFRTIVWRNERLVSE
jgi:hypothetical protein